MPRKKKSAGPIVKPGPSPRAAKATKPRRPKAAKAKAGKPSIRRSNRVDQETGLTPAQEHFARAYVANGCNASAAVRSAYNMLKSNNNSVHAQAAKLLANPKVAQFVHSLQRDAREKTQCEHDLTAAGLIRQMARIAYSDPRRVARWGTRSVTKRKKDGTEYEAEVPYLDLVPSDQLTDDDAAAIASVDLVAGRSGDPMPSVKLSDRRGAVNDLWKMLGYSADASFDLGPLSTADDCLAAQRKIAGASAAGTLSAERAEALERRVAGVLRALEVVEMAGKLGEIERVLARKRESGGHA